MLGGATLPNSLYIDGSGVSVGPSMSDPIVAKVGKCVSSILKPSLLTVFDRCESLKEFYRSNINAMCNMTRLCTIAYV